MPGLSARSTRRRRASSLMEAMLATMLVGIGVTALLALLGAGTMANARATELTVALNLANNVHEYSMPLTFDGAVALDGRTFSPAIDSSGDAISGMDTWAQVLTVHRVSPADLAGAPTGSADVARSTVTVTHNGVAVYAASWLTVDGQ
jgi:hypothetical protein